MAVLIPGGPDLPDRLLHDWTDDRVVFFAGAGVSARAGLPLFWSLIERVFTKLHGGEDRDAFNERKKRLCHFPDRALGELEEQFGPPAVRDAVTEALRHHNGDLGSHRALLALAGLRRDPGGLRLVTTNFDTLFEQAAREDGRPPTRYVAPLLPIPRDDQDFSFSGLVYLHGRIGDQDAGRHDMVLTSADFGRAYLTDGYARRFLLRLAEEFTIVFVGYGLGDPVLRYAFDALSAEWRRSRRRESRRGAYIFRADDGNEAVPAAVTPIVYARDLGHTKLHQTLEAWARWAADPSERIRDALKEPEPPLEEGRSDFVLWSVVDGGRNPGFGAAEFERLARSDSEPTPPISWLTALIRHEERRRRAHDEAAQQARDAGADVHQEPPRAPVHALLAPTDDMAELPAGAPQLIPWIVAHVDDPELILNLPVVSPSGVRLHSRLRHAVAGRLRDTCLMSEPLDRAWRLLAAAARPRSFAPGDLWLAYRALAEGERSPLGVGEIVRCLEPRLRLTRGKGRERRIAVEEASGRSDADARRWTLSDLLSVEVELACGIDGPDLTERLLAVPSPGLSALAWPVTALLEEALRLLASVELAREDWDPGGIVVLIQGRPQREMDGWRALIVLAERAMADLHQLDPRSARLLRQRWRSIRYPTVARLAMAAEIAAGVPDVAEIAEWLGERDGLVMRSFGNLGVLQKLMAVLWPKLKRPARSRLLSVLDHAAFRDIERLRVLDAIARPGAHALPKSWQRRHRRLDGSVTAEIRQLRPAPIQPEDLTALDDQALLARLRENPHGADEAWRRYVHMDQDRAWRLLPDLIADRDIPLRRAQDVLWSLPHEGLTVEAAERALRTIEALADAALAERSAIIADSADAVARIASQVEGGPLDDRAMNEVDRMIVLVVRHEARTANEIDVSSVRTIDALVELCVSRLDSARRSGEADRIRADEQRIERLAADPATLRETIRGLAIQAPFLATVMPEWAHARLVPAFDWSRDAEISRIAWEAWLCFVLRGGKDLLDALRPQLLAAFRPENRERLSEEAQGRLAVFVVRDAIFAPTPIVPEAGLREALRGSTPRMLARALQILVNDVRALKDSRQRDGLWDARLRRLLVDCWPKDVDKRDPEASARLLRLVIALGERFADAFQVLRGLLHEGRIAPYGLIDALAESEHPDRAERAATVRAILALPLDENAWNAEALERIEARLNEAEGSAP